MIIVKKFRFTGLSDIIVIFSCIVRFQDFYFHSKAEPEGFPRLHDRVMVMGFPFVED